MDFRFLNLEFYFLRVWDQKFIHIDNSTTNKIVTQFRLVHEGQLQFTVVLLHNAIYEKLMSFHKNWILSTFDYNLRHIVLDSHFYFQVRIHFENAGLMHNRC